MTLDDKYTYPNSDGVLVNRLGILQHAALDEALNDYASVAWFHLRRLPPPEPPGFEYLRTIHREMFGPVLDWAGELRETDAQATGTGIPYARPEYLEDSARSLFGRLEPLAAYLRDRLLPASGERADLSGLQFDGAARDAARIAGLDSPRPSSGPGVNGSIAYRPDGRLDRGAGPGLTR